MIIKQEGQMFEPVKNYLKSQLKTRSSKETFGYDSHKGVPSFTGWGITIDKYCSNPDVYGADEETIYLCQGKFIDTQKGRLWELIGQAISNRNYCDYLYIFFEKESWEDLKKTESFCKDFNCILNKFQIGLLVITSDLKVEKVIGAGKQKAPEENKNLTRKKIEKAISSSANIKEFIKIIVKNLDIYHKENLPLDSNQPSIYISLKKWQKTKNLRYVIKFLKNKVRVGISVDRDLMKGEFKNKFVQSPRFPFQNYNDKLINKNEKFQIDKGNTHDFHYSFPLEQGAEMFFSDIRKHQKLITEIKVKLDETTKIIDPEFLRSLLDES